MRIAAKIAATAAVSAALIGFGASAASADDWFGGVNNDVYQQCVDEQTALGLINLDLNLLSQCIAAND